MNWNRIKRLLNEYLDGEIGLADKAELERIMAADPAVREEYERLRKLGRAFARLPEVRVHPYAFRERVLRAHDEHARIYFTPQRAFAGAMLVVAVVFAVAFGMYAYQTRTLQNFTIVATPAAELKGDRAGAAHPLVVTVSTTPERFLSRLLLENRLGLAPAGLTAAFATQSRLLEGAVCYKEQGLDRVSFPQPLPKALRITLTPAQLAELGSVAGGLTGSQPLAKFNGGAPVALSGFIASGASPQPLLVYLQFE